VYELTRFIQGTEGYFIILFSAMGEMLSGAMCIEDPTGLVKPCGGKNPVRYEWEDSSGRHMVSVKTVYKVPRLKQEKRGNWFSGEIIISLVDYSDGPGNPCEVIITRQDPRENLGGIGWWNPFGGTITKASRVTYNVNPSRLSLRGRF